MTLLDIAYAEARARSIRLGTNERPGGLPSNPTQKPSAPAERAERVYAAIARGCTTVTLIRRHTGCTADEISVAAQSLAAAGRITSKAGRKGARIYDITT